MRNNLTHEYVSGRGYTVRNAAGKIVAHSLTRAQLDALLAPAASNQLLDVLKSA